MLNLFDSLVRKFVVFLWAYLTAEEYCMIIVVLLTFVVKFLVISIASIFDTQIVSTV